MSPLVLQILRQRRLCSSVQRNTSNQNFLDQQQQQRRFQDSITDRMIVNVEIFQRRSSSVLKHQQQRLQVSFRMWTQCPAESGWSQLCSGSNISWIWSTCCIRFDMLDLPATLPANQSEPPLDPETLDQDAAEPFKPLNERLRDFRETLSVPRQTQVRQELCDCMETKWEDAWRDSWRDIWQDAWRDAWEDAWQDGTVVLSCPQRTDWRTSRVLY